MCTDQDGTVVLMDTDTLDQIEVSKDLFGKNGSYIRDEMKVKVQFYEDKPLSASVPKRVICTVKEVPPHIVAGDAILVNTEDDCYIERLVGLLKVQAFDDKIYDTCYVVFW
ncbi:elongation factor P (EF-P) family protein [Trifolium repens]|nr:elongation factor P (EF-P) family protein [Trifolium repens]